MKNILLLFLYFLFTSNIISAQGEANTHKDDFDFWVGDWNVFQYGSDNLAGHSKIEKILNGNVVKETYRAAQSAYEGTSLNKYNVHENRWEQYWVDNSGITLHIIGGLQEGKMVLQNKEKRGDGYLFNRISWEPLGNGYVRQTWEQKQKESDQWNKVFDGRYEPVEEK